MLSAFCFSTPGEELEVLKVVDDDFCHYLIEYCHERGVDTIAMDLDTRQSMKYGVIDLLRHKLNVIVVDPVYSPIHDKRVLPLNIHRNIDTLHYHFPDAVVIGNLVVQLGLKRMLCKITTVFETEGNPLNILPLNTLNGWKTTSKKENEVGLIVHEYEYQPMESL